MLTTMLERLGTECPAKLRNCVWLKTFLHVKGTLPLKTTQMPPEILFHPWHSIDWHFVPFYCRLVFHYVYIKPTSCPGESGMQLHSH